METATLRPLTFDVESTADILMVKPQKLRDLIVNWRLNPTVRGGKGKGRSHRFSPQMILGLITAGGVVLAPGRCGVSYLANVVRQYQSMSDDALWEHLHKRTNDLEEKYRQEEAFARWQSSPAPWTGANPEVAYGDEYKAAWEYIWERTDRLTAAIAQRLGLGTERMSAQQRRKIGRLAR